MPFKDPDKRREYHKEYMRRRYQEDPGHNAKQKARVNNRTANVRKTNRDWVAQYLNSHPCVDCGESDAIVLEFDHVRGDKIQNISGMTRNGQYGLDKLIVEIAKCDVRCANCHRRATAARGEWPNWRLL